MGRHIRFFEDISDLMRAGAEVEVGEIFPEEIEDEERIGGKRNFISIEEIPDENSDPPDILLRMEEARSYFLIPNKQIPEKQAPEKYKLFSRENLKPFFLEKDEKPDFAPEDIFSSSVGVRAERKALNHKKRLKGKGRKR